MTLPHLPTLPCYYCYEYLLVLSWTWHAKLKQSTQRQLSPMRCLSSIATYLLAVFCTSSRLLASSARHEHLAFHFDLTSSLLGIPYLRYHYFLLAVVAFTFVPPSTVHAEASSATCSRVCSELRRL